MATFLELGLVNADITVMRLLPPEIAYRYHALPVATDGNHITVAMAEPDDPHASRAIQAVINRPICFIHADPELIDSQLQHLWPTTAHHPRLLTWLPAGAAFVDSYIGYLADLLDADLSRFDKPVDQSDSIHALGLAISEDHPDLLVIQARHPSRVMRRVLKESTHDNETGISSFLVLPDQPPWPIKKLLLVLPDSKTGSDLAIGWTEKIAGTGKIVVTVLPVLPTAPLFFGSYLRHDLNGILAGNDKLGVTMRQIANRFTGENIQGVYKLREGDPVTQIRDEIIALQPEMIIMPSCLHPGCNTWLNADLPGMLFKTLAIPMLLTSEE